MTDRKCQKSTVKYTYKCAHYNKSNHDLDLDGIKRAFTGQSGRGIDANFSKNLSGFDDDTIRIKPTSRFKDFLVTVFHEIDHAKDAQKFGKKKYKDRYEMEMNKAVDKGGDAHDDNYFEKKAERYGRKMARKFLKKK